MRVALITDGIWPYVLGGMQKHSWYLCKYLAQNKVQVDLFHFNQSSYDISKLEFFTEEEKKYVNAITLAFPRSLPFPGHYLYNSYRYSKLVYDQIKDHLMDYDIIYTKGFTGWHLIDLKSAGHLKCPPIAVKFHGFEMFQKPPNLKTRLQHLFLLRRPVRSISQKADLVFSYGGKITDIIRSIGVTPEKIRELPSGVERSTLVEAISPTKSPLRFLFLGRYERRKGIEELNTAILLLKSTNPGPEFHFVGPIPDDKRLKRDFVFYHGEVRDKKKLTELIRHCDILVCPSWSEGMPNVILEAMANGLAVMATDVGATNVLVNEETGWLLPSSDPEVICAHIEKILKMESALIDKKKNAALRLIRGSFTWEELIGRFALFFK